jgi:hypothetical protein
LIRKDRKQFKLTKGVVKGLTDMVEYALSNLGVEQKPETIAHELIDANLIEGYYDNQARIKKRRKTLKL